ncbi:hypothetical protein CNYM01_12895 [Colletotrichum nymphaeae SA-01]|uniref:Azaphilone pigments biosynthesis cluster protein L N-terminal domain-containing protein n=1 Tax=Colletotrichum nymphaeae SA-01 TaxID=1460502 RepID=A0A135USQ4_9PEZI|nr:hypothetical protein CNYM01_12895 [Colletotrichum nymphaeae SA-01]
MAEALGIASALIAIVTATIQTSQTLYNTIQSFRSHQRSVQQLLDELSALKEVLQSLDTHIQIEDNANLASLKTPLLQCRRACADFDTLMNECTKYSGRPRTSFRGWVKVRYMESDINGFTSMLAGYKSTIAIALGDANLRSATVTIKLLGEYKDMINSTTQDLEDHLDDINEKLSRLTSNSTPSSHAVITDIDRIQNERDSTEICLQICAKVQAHIDTMRLQPIPGSPPSQGMSCRDLGHATVMTLSTLDHCKQMLADNVSELHRHQDENKRRLARGLSEISLPTETDIQSLKKELDSTKECLAICNAASQRAVKGVHVLEDMSTGHDGQQLFVSTLGDLFNVKGASTGDRGIQFVGSVSEEALRIFFQSQTKK